MLLHERRRIIHFNVTAHPTADWTAQQLREAFPFDQIPRYLLRDRDSIFGGEFRPETSHGGVVTAAVRSAVEELARAHPEKIVLADSRERTGLFRGVIVKPNQQEAQAACRALFGRTDYGALRRHTRFTARFVSALAATLDGVRAAESGNLVASITIMKRGTGTASPAAAGRCGGARGVRLLAIHIGGAKFSMAAFENVRMVRRETRATDREGGREWMLERIGGLARAWHREAPFDRAASASAAR